MHLTEKQCALLDGYMYLDQSVKKRGKRSGNTIGETIKDLKGKTTGQFKLDQLNPTGGITKEEAVELLKEIERDPVLRNLKAVHSVDTGIRATCFVDSKARGTKDAIVAFRGTGGITKSWVDNMVGAYEPVTAMQQEAVDFVRDTCSDYMISQVTGHSKGGNLAMNVTIASGRIINECVAFDAQGFNRRYKKNNRLFIEKNAKKIKCINASKDFVSPLLHKVALQENIEYIKKPGVKYKEGHNLTSLTDNKLFDSNGHYKPEVISRRHILSKGIKAATIFLDGTRAFDLGRFIVDLAAVRISAKMTKEPERELAQKPESKKRELNDIKAGKYHPEKDIAEEKKDRVSAKNRDIKTLKLSRKKYYLTNKEEIESIKEKGILFDRDKVKISKMDLEFLKKEALEGSRLAGNVIGAHELIELAKKQAEQIVSEAKDNASGPEEAKANAILKKIRSNNRQYFQGVLYVGNIPQNKQQVPNVKRTLDTKMINIINHTFEKVSKYHMTVEQINSIEGKELPRNKEYVIVAKDDITSLKESAFLTGELLKNDISPQEMLKFAQKEADRIVKEALNEASEIKEKSGIVQLQKLKNDHPEFFKNDKYVWDKHRNRNTNHSKVEVRV